MAVFSCLAKGIHVRTIVYVDGYNLFYGCLKHTNDKWLDLYKLLFEKIIYQQDTTSEPIQIKFFTADIKAKIASHGDNAQQAQQTYHRALLKQYPNKVSIINGYYSLEKANLLAYRNPPDKTNRVEVWKLEEKQTDVNIAIESYRDAIRGNADQLVFVSNDTDLAPALAAIRDELQEKIQIGVIIPARKPEDGKPHRPGNKQLSQYADWERRYISDEELAQSHLPNIIPTKKKPLLKPLYW